MSVEHFWGWKWFPMGITTSLVTKQTHWLKSAHLQVAIVVKNLPANAEDTRDTSLVPGSGRSPGGVHSSPLQYSCLENPMDRGAWWAIVHRVIKSGTQLKRPSTVHTLCRVWTSDHRIYQDETLFPLDYDHILTNLLSHLEVPLTPSIMPPSSFCVGEQFLIAPFFIRLVYS